MALNVDENGILQPLGVYVLRGMEFVNNVREHTDSIPGRDGEYFFGAEMEAGLINLPVSIETTPSTWAATERLIKGYLNPKLGVQALTFANRPGITYNVVWVGTLNFLEEGAFHRKFTIPFKLHDPIVKSSSQNTLAGAGTAVNGGTIETPFTVEIVGPVTNPAVTVAGTIMTYTGQVTASDLLVIDTEKRTAIFNGVNALADYNKAFPKLAVGNNTVTITGGTVTLKWYDRYL
jgi:phage-related protein